MAWIKSNQNLERNPKLYDLMSTIQLDISCTIGTLHRFWWWVMDYAEDGDLSKFKPIALANACGIKAEQADEFVHALVSSGFLDREPYLRVHDWWDHAGAYLQTKYKQRPEKHKSIQNKCLHGEPLPVPDNNVTRTDKIKIDKIDEDRQKELRESIMTTWNASGLQSFNIWTVSRIEKLRVRLKEALFAERWMESIKNLSSSSFATGNGAPRNPGEKPWKADIDWFLKDDLNYVKALEGKYNDEQLSKYYRRKS